MLGRENSYVLISKLDDMPDDTSTMSWSQKRGSAFPTHRGTAMLKKRKKSEFWDDRSCSNTAVSIDASVTPITPQQGTTKRSWFGNLFSFKPASYDIVLTHCAVINDGREIVRRCLQEQGVAVKSIDHDGMLALKCKVTDTRDISGSHIKGVRFRIEFTRTLCIAGGHERFAMNACLTLEKGAQSLFTATYNSLKKAVESDDRPLPSPVPTTISEPITMPRPRVQNQRPSIFAALNVGPLNVGASPRIGNISAPTSPQFGPQFGTFQFTGVQRPNTIRF
jgi:hypothetical protein